MAKEVHLLKYWMPLIRNLKEFKGIAKSEEPELRAILEAIDSTLNNMFLETADEYGISRFESMMRIIPEEESNLETRRFKVITLWNDCIPFTRFELYKRLVSICGYGEFELIERYSDYLLEVYTHLEVSGAFDAVLSTLNELLPCNIDIVYVNNAPIKSPLTVCSGMAVRVIEHIRV